MSNCLGAELEMSKSGSHLDLLGGFVLCWVCLLDSLSWLLCLYLHFYDFSLCLISGITHLLLFALCCKS